jgi:GT2 family glycosyltransferase/glycosyltransferase involved in cell wall biosynthesis
MTIKGMDDIIEGWGWWNSEAAASGFPPAWREFLKEQTLAPAGSEGNEVLYLVGAGLGGDPPGSDPTLLERLAFALLAWPDTEAVVQPLYLSAEGGVPVPAAQLAGAPWERIAESGFIALGRAPVRKLAARLDEAPGGLLSRADRAGLPVLVLPRALLEERGRLERRPPAAGRLGRLPGWVQAPVRRLLSPAQRRWLLRRLGRRVPADAGALPAHHRTDPGLARHRAWEPDFPTPGVKLRPRPDDGRTTVWFAVHWLELGGAEKFAIDLIRALPKDRYRVVVTTDVPSANPWTRQVAEHAEEILHLPEFLPETQYGAFAAHFVASRNVRLIHIHHSPRIYAALSQVRRSFPHIKVLHTLHILELPPHPGGYPEHVLQHYGAFIDHHHVISRHLRQFLRQRWRVAEERIDVVYLNVDADHFDPARVPRGTVRATHGIPADAVVVGFVGRFNRQKQPREFVAMAADLRERWRGAGRPEALRFLMAGGGELRPEVEAAIRAGGLEDCVHLHGEVLDTRPVYADCDLIVLPSENEGLALVAYEAMAMARPVVSTDVGAQRELVPRELLVAEGPGLAGRLADLAFVLAADPELRARVGAACRAHVLECHRQERTFEAMGGLYERLLGGEPAVARSAEGPDGEGWRLEEPDLARRSTRIPVAVAVVSYNHRDALVQLLKFLDGKGIPTFVTENASTDGTREAIRGRFAHVTVLESPANLGGTGGFNCAVLAALDAGSDYLLLVDDDALPEGDCIERLATFLDDHHDYAFAAPAIYITGTEGVLQEAGGGVDFARPMAVQAWHRFRVEPRLPACLEVDYASACCLMVRADDIRAVGVMDWNFFIFSDDVDLSLRLRRSLGKRGACVTGARASHDFPWTKPFSPMRLYYFARNGLYLTSRHAEGESRTRALRWALRRHLRRMAYAAAIGDREVALTLWRALRDSWTGRYGRWRDPVAFPQGRAVVDTDYLRRHRIVRVLVDITVEDIDRDVLAALREAGGEALSVDVLCDLHRVDVYREKGLFAQVRGRAQGLRGPLRDWWRVYRGGYDLVVTDAGMEPRRPSGAAARRAAFFHAGTLYEARAARLLAPLAHMGAFGFAVLASALLHRRFLKAPEPGKPSPEAAAVLESLGYDGAVGQPWARSRKAA